MRDPPGSVRTGSTTRTDNGLDEGREDGGGAAALREWAGGRLPPPVHPATAAASASTASHLTFLGRTPAVRGSCGHAVRSGDRQRGGTDGWPKGCGGPVRGRGGGAGCRAAGGTGGLPAGRAAAAGAGELPGH